MIHLIDNNYEHYTLYCLTVCATVPPCSEQ